MAEASKVLDQVVKAVVEKEGKYLTFSLADEEYGIGILKIKEIIGMLPVTSVPQTPDFVKGVINL
ncbi:MAG: chemotaxis protein CheW, partial [Deltaproteobacteria bacterium]|nr:chemotaxis protein CheW [Deltaproteobacteria bacterium]